MKLEKIAPIAEVVSSVAIVATLVYLSVQTQQTNNALIANSRATSLMADLTMISMLVSNPEVAVNAQKPVAELTAGQDGQVGNAFAAMLRTREFAWLQYQAGILDRPTFESYMETMVRWIREFQADRYYWEYFSQYTNPEFAEYVNSRLQESQQQE